MKLPEKESINSIIKQQAKDEITFNEEVKKLTEKNDIDFTQLQEKEKKSQEFYLKFKQLFTQRDKLSDEIQEQEKNIEDLREQSKDIEIEMNGVSLKRILNNTDEGE